MPSPLLHTRHCLFNGVNLCLLNYHCAVLFYFLLASTLGGLRYSSISVFGVLSLLRLWQVKNAEGHWLQSVSSLKMIFLTYKWNHFHLFQRFTIPHRQLLKTQRTSRDVSPLSKTGGPRSSDMKTAAANNSKCALWRTDSYFREHFSILKKLLPPAITLILVQSK